MWFATITTTPTRVALSHSGSSDPISGGEEGGAQMTPSTSANGVKSCRERRFPLCLKPERSCDTGTHRRHSVRD
ncbi:vacuolar protein sorting-associated protein 13D-like [Acipenser oxyrinchus oxyrinchus]|uniref:Vacuolar protein sorting-associated protein 13D-like n=1 Tax=Acipenser oxyrinchus oxyrinchus TaxID=40147 RepID=A0AAD8CDT8_ACIOX|nr:vacuolar protein sorting-associated protein 13D-like [Acipenser oxyrinchus oxyrinchus]